MFRVKLTALLAGVIGMAAQISACSVAADDPKNVVRVASPQPGIVVKVNVKEGQEVKKGDALIQLDDRIAGAKLSIQNARLAMAKAELNATEKSSDEAKNRYVTQQKLRKTGTTSEEDLQAAKLSWERSEADLLNKAEAVKLAAAELRLAELVVDELTIRSPTDGVVQSILVKPGEAAKGLEPVILIREAGAR